MTHGRPLDPAAGPDLPGRTGLLEVSTRLARASNGATGGAAGLIVAGIYVAMNDSPALAEPLALAGIATFVAAVVCNVFAAIANEHAADSLGRDLAANGVRRALRHLATLDASSPSQDRKGEGSPDERA